MRNKIISILFVIAVAIMIMTGKVYAVDNFSVKVTTSADTVLPGGTVVLHVAIPTIDVEKGIGTIAGVIEYDKDVFKNIDMDSIEQKKGWDGVTYNSSNGKFVTLRSNGKTITEGVEVFDVTLDVLSTAKTGSTTVKFKELNSSDGDKDIDTEDVPVTLTIKGDTAADLNIVDETNVVSYDDIIGELNGVSYNTTDGNKAVNNTTDGNKAVNNTTDGNKAVNNTTKGNNTVNYNNTNTSKGNNVSILPYAGESDAILLGVGILLIAVVVGYFKIMSLKGI